MAQLLHEAILVAERTRDRTVLRHLRGARLSLHESFDTDVPIRVDIISGRVFARGLPIAFSRAELAVVIALALNERGVPSELLAEDLYPNADITAAANTLKVNVHRVRRRAGSHNVIRHADGRYRLGETIDVDLPRAESELRCLRLGRCLTSEARDRMERLRRRVLEGRPAFILQWSWFDETEQRLRELGRELTLLLARDALDEEHYQRALELVAELGREDPLDEVAAEIAIRAFLLAGDHAAAVLHYRRYASVLQREINSRPSEDLRALVREA
ncbi:MAG TPA: BTAD domain-containing putative transcriptional regulator [Xanthomonadaceae bacterium]|nr:BTAD domain-containing putative transcriptional regulator [Xanthomonadaceae bacterium]HEV2740099.1 BTAD domain-containing putative transcriptional regulator [Candidatus Elarobacter sp.]